MVEIKVFKSLPVTKKRKWAIFLSGSGSNFRALLDHYKKNEIACIVSDKPNAEGLLKAKRFGITTYILNLSNQNKVNDFLDAARFLESIGVTDIFLLGFMRVVPKEFLEKWGSRIWNLHPSLLPLYPGLNSLDKAYKDNSNLGLSVHEVNEVVDAGKVLLQKQIHRVNDLQSQKIILHLNEHKTVKKWF